VRHLRSDAYSAEQVLLHKRQIYGGAPKLDRYQVNFEHGVRNYEATRQALMKGSPGRITSILYWLFRTSSPCWWLLFCVGKLVVHCSRIKHNLSFSSRNWQ